MSSPTRRSTSLAKKPAASAGPHISETVALSIGAAGALILGLVGYGLLSKQATTLQGGI